MSMDRSEYLKEYNKRNVDKISKQKAEYYLKNKEKIDARNKEWAENNKDRFKELQKENHIKNKEAKSLKMKLKKESNPEYFKEKHKKYYAKHRESILEKQRNNKDKYRSNRLIYLRTYRKQRKLSDPIYLLKESYRKSLWMIMNRNGLSKEKMSKEILGCSYSEFKSYIESKFQDWMTWGNYGLYNGELNYGWDLDHITPISLAKTEEDIIKLNHYTNFQPLCSYTNRHIKTNKL